MPNILIKHLYFLVILIQIKSSKYIHFEFIGIIEYFKYFLCSIFKAITTCPIENYCRNGGTCSLENELLTCSCSNGVYGRQCEINNCYNQSCNSNGKCFGELNGYRCTCKGNRNHI